MTAASNNRPDLQRIGQTVFPEVLGVLLSLPATLRNSSNLSPHSDVPDQIVSTVLLAGQRLSGSVHLTLPMAFVAHAVNIIAGLEDHAQDANAILDDAAGELANMVAGQVAVQFAADGYPCTLGTPSIARGKGPPIETHSEVDHGRTELLCDGHLLSLDLNCRYGDA
jgi:CheY-specific phosphatase CheX